MYPSREQPDYRFANLLRETYWLMREAIDLRLAPMGLSHAQWRPLICLYAHDGPMTQTQLARALGLESPTVVRLLDRLTDKDWIVRRSCPQDRRAYHVMLTPKARKLCVEIDKVVTQVRRAGMAGVAAAELSAAIGVLERVHRQFTALVQAPPQAQQPEGSIAPRKRTRKAKPIE